MLSPRVVRRTLLAAALAGLAAAAHIAAEGRDAEGFVQKASAAPPNGFSNLTQG
jgi:citrate lyase beta subunit